jgi:hypothetical protein
MATEPTRRLALIPTFLLTCGHSDRVVTRPLFNRVILVIRSNE